MDKSQEDDSFNYALHLVGGILPMNLRAAIELGVFEILAKAGECAKLSASQIASQMPTTNPDAPVMLDRILVHLASHSVVHCAPGVGVDGKPVRLYSLSPVSKYFVRNADGVSLGPIITMGQNKVFLDCWPHLKDAVLEGGMPFKREHGVGLYEYLDKDPKFNQVFNTAMFNHTTLVMKKILESYKGFENLKKVVDVGGGLGVNLSIITSKYPTIKGVNFDLPHVIKDAPSYPGVEHMTGDMFESVPEGDAIFLKWVVHNWNDDQCLKLLKNCYKSIPDDGKVIVVEESLPFVVDTSVSVKYSAELDIIMMMSQVIGGRKRTKEEFIDLATRAGFKGIRFECFVGNSWVMEFFK